MAAAVRILRQKPSDLELTIGQALVDLEANGVQEIRELVICCANEVDTTDHKKVVVIYVPFRLLRNFHKIQQRLVRELEKKLSKFVLILAQRRILPKVSKHNRVHHQKRPISRTLTSVHDRILEDLVFPVDIVGKRIRHAPGASRVTKVYLDPKEAPNCEEKVHCVVDVYKKLTGKKVVFQFHE
eukprot:gnl/Spiro4/23282_TR11508_c0_g1_i1.p2 gnl/Spiro4/23282_TR11508_c0_g1~~gnl/Spiro4/23282_TR11508_c0_g1_i1.p2  ORF type:complete len:195 (+),score=66.52 gnl/Spiro4/23282_TR11508_c0_g1_i1:36-587(+)